MNVILKLLPRDPIEAVIVITEEEKAWLKEYTELYKPIKESKETEGGKYIPDYADRCFKIEELSKKLKESFSKRVVDHYRLVDYCWETDDLT